MWRRTVKIGAVIFDVNRITTIKAKRHTRKSQLPPHKANAQPPPTYPRYQRTFRTPIGLAEHIRTSFGTWTVPTVVSPLTPPSLSTDVDRPPELPLPSFSTASTSAAVVSAMHINITHNPNTLKNINTATVNTSDEDQVYTCSECDCTVTPHICLVGHLRIRHMETGEPVPGAPTFTLHIRLHCPHCLHTLMHRMGLFGPMRIHVSGVDRSLDTPSTSNTPTMPSSAHTPSPCALTTISSTSTIADADTADFSCSQCLGKFTLRIGLVIHLRIHRTETGEPVPGVLTYTRRIRLNFPHCTRAFINRMGLLGHMRIRENLW
ncbi:hypothetical protein SprV_0501864000 [Sparganum proliferum]